MKKFFLLSLSFLCTLFTFAIDPSGSRVSSESSGLSFLDVVYFIFGAIFLVVIGIPFTGYCLKSNNKDDNNFGCFMLVGFLLLIIILVATCSK